MKASEAQIRAISKWQKANTVQYTFRLNKEADRDIIELIEQEENRNAFIKKALREYLKNA